jgi:hypothetical protein
MNPIPGDVFEHIHSSTCDKPDSIFPQIMIRAALLPEPCRPDERGRFPGPKAAAFHAHILIENRGFHLDDLY